MSWTIFWIAVGVIFWAWRSGRRTRSATSRKPARVAAPSKASARIKPIAAAAPVVVEPNLRPPPAYEPVVVPMHFGDADATPRAEVSTRRAPSVMPVAWMPEGAAVTIGGYEISGGLLYVGDRSRSIEFKNEPSVVDPTLSVVGPVQLGNAVWGASYWPSYDRLTPFERGLFLKWLSTGRNRPDADIGIVFVYFYGLERRLLLDAQRDDDARREVPRLIAEIDRLRRIYSHGAFARYAGELRDLAIALYADTSRFRCTAPLDRASLPTGLALVLARHVHDKLPLTDALAYAWARCLDEAPRASTYRAAAEELEALFSIRYREAFPQGLVIAPPKRHLSLDHRGAAANRVNARLTTDLPDIRGITAPQRPLAKLLESSLTELQPLIRVRRKATSTPLDEAAALPVPLRAGAGTAVLAPLAEFTSEKLAQATVAVVDSAALLRAGGIEAASRWGKRECTTLLAAVECLGVGVEPDVRWDGALIDGAKPVVLFRHCGMPSSTPTSNYRAAQVLLQLSVSVALADGACDRNELDEAMRHIDRLFALDEAERRRMEAHLAWLEISPPSLTKLAGKLKPLDLQLRRTAADVIVQIAAVDGAVDPKEMRTLGKIYRSLGLDETALSSDVHRALTRSPDSPAPSSVAKPGLDAAAIARKLQETADVQNLLKSIFVDEPIEVAAPAVRVDVPDATTGVGIGTAVPASIGNLDEAHSTLLRRILDHPEEALSRTHVERWCDELGLMPDGAMENINETAFAMADDALLDVDDDIEIRVDIRQILTHTLRQGASA